MLKIDFNFSFIIIFIIFSYLIYNYYNLVNNKINITNSSKYLILAIRIIILVLILILYINPNINIENNNNNILNVIIDNSTSMKYYDEEINSVIKKIDKWANNEMINLDFFLFGENFRNIKNINKIDFTDRYTNFSDLFHNLNYSDNVLLLSDGLNNHGSRDIVFSKDNNINVIGFGDNSLPLPDIKIELIDSVIHKDSLEIRVNINRNISKQFDSGKIYLSNKSNNKYMLDSFSFDLEQYNDSLNLKIPFYYLEIDNKIYIDNFSIELNHKNNSFNLDLDNIDKINKKLIIISGSISPNTSYIKNIIKNYLYNYKIDHIYRINQNIWNDSIENYDLFDYDLIVFDDFPLYKFDENYINGFDDILKQDIIYFLGPNTMENNFIFDYYECVFSNNDKNIINNFSNDLWYNNKYYYIEPNEVGFNIQCEKNSIDYDNGNTFVSINDNSILFFNPSLDSKENSNNLSFNELLLDIVDNEIYNNNRQFEIFTNYNNIELQDSCEILLKFYSNTKNKNIFINIYKDNMFYNRFNGFKSIDDYNYIKNISFETPGNYSLQVEVIFNEISSLSNFLNIDVKNIDYELLDMGLDVEFLSIIANNNKGYYSNSINIDELLENIEISNVNNVNYTKYDFKNYSYLLLFLVFLLSLEWYVRNKVGLV